MLNVSCWLLLLLWYLYRKGEGGSLGCRQNEISNGCRRTRRWVDVVVVLIVVALLYLLMFLCVHARVLYVCVGFVQFVFMLNDFGLGNKWWYWMALYFVCKLFLL